jgi:hydrophobic/amphiphilic exporter-1 (mainly G- bacteria), HAE1 family
MEDRPMNIIRLAIRQPVFTTMVMAALVVLGLFSYSRLNIDEYPDVSIPIVSIRTVYPGASPDAVEREVTRIVEEAINTIAGIDRVTSMSLEGRSVVVAEFELDVDNNVAAQDVSSKLDQIRRTLPLDIEPPIIEKFDPSAKPILSLALTSSSMTLRDVTALADNVVKPALEGLGGVASAELVGGVEREVQVRLDPARMEGLGIGTTDVIGALQRQNLDVPAGYLERSERETLVRVQGRFRTPEEFGDVIVAMRSGVPLRLREVADIVDGEREARGLALLDGEVALGLDIRKVSGTNTVGVAEGVKEAMREIAAGLPDGVELRLVQDNSTFIEDSVRDVKVALLIGAILTVMIVFLFLGDWRATTITALSLPISVISAFLIMDALGFTLNTMTLMALSLSVGFLIDDAIVVIENIARHRRSGTPPAQAAAEATGEIGLAVTATTFTILAVFIPVAFMDGIVGKFFHQFALTVAWAVLVSLFVSFTLTPMLAARWTGSPDVAEARRATSLTRVSAFIDARMDRMAARYHGLLGWALDHRRTTVGIALTSLAGALALLPVIGGEFMTSSDRGYFYVFFDAPADASITYTQRKAVEVDQRVRALPGVAHTYTAIGGGSVGSVGRGEMLVKLVARSDRSLNQEQLMQRARASLAAIHGIDVSVLEAGKMGQVEKPIQIDIRGPDLAELERLSATALDRLGGVSGVIELESTLADARTEYRVRVQRETAASIGLSVAQVAAAVRSALAGETATTWEAPDGSINNVVVRLPDHGRTGLGDLGRIPVVSRLQDPGATGAFIVPLAQVADVAVGTGPARIDRKGGQRVVTVLANTAPGTSVQQVGTAARTSLASLDLPAGYTMSLGGETEDFEETRASVGAALLLSVLLIYMILASQFGSFSHPLVIMISLPLSLVGALLALLLTGDTVNIMSMIGFILLMGLVTKNAILLVDFAKARMEAGAPRREALLEAGRIRLRPILMTAMTLIFGVLPVALALGQGAEFRAPMARVVIGGMITATLLTLVVIPVVYSYVDDSMDWLRAMIRARRPRPGQRDSIRNAQDPGPVEVA